MTIVLIGKDIVLEGSTTKTKDNRVTVLGTNTTSQHDFESMIFHIFFPKLGYYFFYDPARRMPVVNEGLVWDPQAKRM